MKLTTLRVRDISLQREQEAGHYRTRFHHLAQIGCHNACVVGHIGQLDRRAVDRVEAHADAHESELVNNSFGAIECRVHLNILEHLGLE